MKPEDRIREWADAPPSITISAFQEISRQRSEFWHLAGAPGADAGWSGVDWSNAMSGEVGELLEVIEALALGLALSKHSGMAANLVKKLRRHESGLNQARDLTPSELRAELGSELADVQAYLALLADHFDIDLEKVVIEKFNAVTVRAGLPEDYLIT